MIDWKELLTEVTRFLSMLGIAFGLTWTIARPFAEDFITQTVSEKFRSVDARFNKIEASQAAMSATQIRVEQELKHQRFLQEEVRSDVKELLRNRR